MNNELFTHKEALKNILEIEKFLSQFGTSENYSRRRLTLQEMNFQDFQQLLLRTAKIVRNMPEEMEVTFDGEYENAIAHGVVLKEDKLECLETTWNIMRKFIDDESLPDYISLSYATLVFANGILLIHPFKDGNGRTVRILSYGILNGEADCDYINEVLLRHGGLGNDVWTLEGGIRFTSFDKSLYGGNQPDKITFASNNIGTVYIDEPLLREFLEKFSFNDNVKSIMNQFMHSDGNESTLDGYKFVEAMFRNSNDEEKQKLNSIFLSIRYRRQFRCTMNAFLTEQATNYEGNSFISKSTFEPIWGNIGLEESNRAKQCAQRFFDKDVMTDGLNDDDIATLPLRAQLLIERSSIVKRFIENVNMQNSFRI